MAIDRSELYEGGRAYWKAPFNGGMAMKLRAVTILSVERAACKVRVADSGVETTLRFNQLQADDEYLSSRDKAEDAKKERIRREALSVPEAPVPRGQMRLVPNSKPLTTTLGEVLAAKAQVVALTPPPAEPPPAPPAPPPPPEPVAEDVPVVPPKKKKQYKLRNKASAQFLKSGKYLTRLRELRGFSRPQAAHKVGVGYQTLYSWETGITRPRGDGAKKLARLYKVPIAKIEAYDQAEERVREDARATPRPSASPKPPSTPPKPIPTTPTRPRPPWPKSRSEVFLKRVRGARVEPPLAEEHLKVTVDDALDELGLNKIVDGFVEETQKKKKGSRQQSLPFPGFTRWAQAGRDMLEPLALELAAIEEQLVPLELRYEELRRRKADVVGRKSAVEAALAALEPGRKP